MYIEEKYFMYHMAYTLVKNHEYDILYLNHRKEEIWLEKLHGRTTYLIRLFHRSFDWKNHLKKDIQTVFYRVQQMKRFLVSKTVIIHNIYVANETPIDTWETLKKPLHIKENKSQTMYVYYLSQEQNFHHELKRIEQNTGTFLETDLEGNKPVELTDHIQQLQSYLSHMFEQKRKEFMNVLSFGKPRITYLFILINIVMFLILEGSGGSTNIDTLIQLGAKFNPAILINGEWWRIFTSMFLHIGFFHLFMNMLALFYLGVTVERIFGSLRFITIYLLAGIGGGLASFASSFQVSAGASGAIFGLFGALLFFGFIHKKIFYRTMGRSLITIIVLNLVFGLLVPQIDMGAHLGGLIFGFIIASVVHLPNKKEKKYFLQGTMLLLYIFLSLGLVYWGIDKNKSFIQNHIIEQRSDRLLDLHLLEEYEKIMDKWIS